MNIVTKDFPVIGGEPTEEHPNGTFEVILSAPTLDRDNEVIDARAFDPLPAHITFDTDHSMTCDSVVGSGVPSYADDGTLRVKGGFASDTRSQTIRQKVTDGHIRSTSVTFMAADRQKDDKGVVHIKTAELLNGTFTPVPSNREAVVLTAKSITANMPALPALKTGQMWSEQMIKAWNARPESKSIVGSVEALQDRVQDALEDTYPRSCYIRGVLPSVDGGTVIFDTWTVDYDLESYSQTYTDDGSVVTLTGSPVEVDVMEIVTPDADTARDEGELKSAVDTAEEAAAPAAADPAVKTADIDARQRVNENAALIAFGG